MRLGSGTSAYRGCAAFVVGLRPFNTLQLYNSWTPHAGNPDLSSGAQRGVIMARTRASLRRQDTTWGKSETAVLSTCLSTTCACTESIPLELWSIILYNAMSNRPRHFGVTLDMLPGLIKVRQVTCSMSSSL